jgi:hypothetical protein
VRLDERLEVELERLLDVLGKSADKLDVELGWLLGIVFEKVEDELEIGLDWLPKFKELKELPEVVLEDWAGDEVPDNETIDESEDNVDGLARGME